MRPDAAAERKLADLNAIVGTIADPVVAYSGGVDSSLVTIVARRVHGIRMRAVLADSPSLPRRELHAAVALAGRHDVPLEVVSTDELTNPRYQANGADRCAFCKDALVEAVLSAPGLADRTLLLGVNVDDLGDHRPGQELARRRGARFPLVEAGLTKADVRSIARYLGIETWAKPAAACLASRIAYGVPVTTEGLERIERAEEALRRLGFSGDVRVRDQGRDLARIEVPTDSLEALVQRRDEVVAALHAAGFRYVTVDLEGFRSGSQNLAIRVGERPHHG